MTLYFFLNMHSFYSLKLKCVICKFMTTYIDEQFLCRMRS